MAAIIAVPACDSGIANSNETYRVVELGFGTSQYAWNTGEDVESYIANFDKVLPQAAKLCGAELLGINGQITDGGEAAYFRIFGNSETTVTCLKRQFPHGILEGYSRKEWEAMRANYPEFPIPPENFPIPT